MMIGSYKPRVDYVSLEAAARSLGVSVEIVRHLGRVGLIHRERFYFGENDQFYFEVAGLEQWRETLKNKVCEGEVPRILKITRTDWKVLREHLDVQLERFPIGDLICYDRNQVESLNELVWLSAYRKKEKLRPKKHKEPTMSKEEAKRILDGYVDLFGGPYTRRKAKKPQT